MCKQVLELIENKKSSVGVTAVLRIAHSNKNGLFWQQSAISQGANCFPPKKIMKAVGTKFFLRSLLTLNSDEFKKQL